MKKSHCTEVKALPDYHPPSCAWHFNAALSSHPALPVRGSSFSAEEGLGSKGPFFKFTAFVFPFRSRGHGGTNTPRSPARRDSQVQGSNLSAQLVRNQACIVIVQVVG